MEPRPGPRGGRRRRSRSRHLRRPPAQRVPTTRRREAASKHFSFSEVACHCDGKYASCPRIWQKRSAFRMMERYRSKSGLSLDVISACRCPSRNAAVGGSPTSRHLTGRACDVEAIFSVATVKSWGWQRTSATGPPAERSSTSTTALAQPSPVRPSTSTEADERTRSSRPLVAPRFTCSSAVGALGAPARRWRCPRRRSHFVRASVASAVVPSRNALRASAQCPRQDSNLRPRD